MKGCRGVCDTVSVGKPFGDPYKTHVLCRRCASWYSVKSLKIFRCPCCKSKLRTRSPKSSAKQRLLA